MPAAAIGALAGSVIAGLVCADPIWGRAKALTAKQPMINERGD